VLKSYLSGEIKKVLLIQVKKEGSLGRLNDKMSKYGSSSTMNGSLYF
jgi:hypothetical protein